MYRYANQRYIRKDKTASCSFLQSICSQLGQIQGFQSKGLIEYMSYYSCHLSYAKVSELLARNLGQCVYTGSQIQHKILALRPVIEASEAMGVARQSAQVAQVSKQLSFNFIAGDIDLYAPNQAEILYFDDAVGVTKQKAHRNDITYCKSEKYVQTDNVVIQRKTGDFEYLSANKKVENSVAIADKINQYLSAEFGTEIIPLVPITDGAKTIRNRIHESFGETAPIILDYYHLRKKVTAQFSRLGQSKDNKERHIKAMLKQLWHGQVRDALIYSEHEMLVPLVRQPILEDLQSYLLKHEAEIIDYDTRFHLTKKCIGSGRGEKANDQIITDRQKHNGTSWSEDGSAAIAQLKCLQLNKRWDAFWAAA